MADLLAEIKRVVDCEVTSDEQTLDKFSRDASIFDVKPQVVVFAESSGDIESLVMWANARKNSDKSISLSVRAAGTCMSGGSLTDSVLISVSKLNKIKSISNAQAVVEPGVYYRDLEKEIFKHDLAYPPFTSSKNICAVGGMVGNNAGGEKSLQYGKAEDFVEELKVVLADGREHVIKPLTKGELERKITRHDFEGKIYREIFKIVDENFELLQEKKPQVSKNSAGYNLFRVWDKKTFDLTKLFVGAQGTLGIVTEISFKVIPRVKHRGLLVVYMDDFKNIPEIVKTVLAHNPDSFETFDYHTFRLALRYFWGFAKTMHINLVSVTMQFLPLFLEVLARGMPKLVLLVEYENDDLKAVHENLNKLSAELTGFENLKVRIAKNEKERDKFWAIRRESFNLLRQRVKDKYASPFIDDTIVDPQVLPDFFPKIYKILNENKLLYTIAGHIGNGNFHIIPLVNLRDKAEIDKIFKVNKEVFDLVFSFKGSHSGEHNDGLIRTPYLAQMYGEKVYSLFVETKKIFDPGNIFNPGKKVNGDIEFAKSHIRQNW